MSDDDEEIAFAVAELGLTAEELAVLVEYCRREHEVWAESAHYQTGQVKRKANMIAKHFKLRMEKWIELTAVAEVEYEEHHGVFKEEQC